MFKKKSTWIIIVIIVIVLLAIRWSSIGPTKNNFSRGIAIGNIQVALSHYHKDIGDYPTFLAELVPKYMSSVPVDPITKTAYDYKKLTDSNFQICFQVQNQSGTSNTSCLGSDDRLK